MNKLFAGVGVATMASVGVVSISAFRGEPLIRPNTIVGGANLGGLKPEDAQFKLRVWWEGERQKKLILKSPHLKKGLPGMTPGQLGVALDDVATVAMLPTQDVLQGLVPGEESEQRFEPVFKTIPSNTENLRKLVQEALPEPRLAQVLFKDGTIVRRPETPGYQLDVEKLPEAVLSSVKEGKPTVTIPIEEAPKRISDEQLEKIKEVVSTFSTNFPRNPNRNANIRLAASKLDGIVLAPGERVSFNESVGQRTRKAGFKEAGVFINGRHDTGVGGGICQVSTTLYNASLFANLKIVKRTNHSLPVAYVPLGRDATVNWGAQDLVIENNYDVPIAINSHYQSGKLTFRILGQKTPGLSVKIERSKIRTWSGGGTKTYYDPKLPPGTRRVVESGGTNKQVSTTRVVYMNGEEVKREPLGRSTYSGGMTVIAVGPKARPKARRRVSRETDSQQETPVVQEPDELESEPLLED